MLVWMAAAMAQENGVLLCDDYEPFFPEVQLDPLCGNEPDPAISRVNACFTTCTSDQQQFRITVVNRGGVAAEDLVVKVLDGDTEVWSDTIRTLQSGNSVQMGPISLSPNTYSAGMIAVVETLETDCQPIGNERALSTALFGGEWPEPSWDADGDGFADAECGGEDCDDSDSRIHPGAPEDVGEDNDCDGFVNEDIRRCATAPGALGLFALPLLALAGRRQWSTPQR